MTVHTKPSALDLAVRAASLLGASEVEPPSRIYGRAWLRPHTDRRGWARVLYAPKLGGGPVVYVETLHAGFEWNAGGTINMPNDAVPPRVYGNFSKEFAGVLACLLTGAETWKGKR